MLRDPLDAPGKAESVEWTPRRKAKVAIMTAPAMAPFQVSEVVPGADLTTDDEILDWVKQAAETTYHPVATAGSARGFRTSSLLTLHWRKPDSNHRSREGGDRRLGCLICCSREFPRCRLFRLSGPFRMRSTK
jgi:hypothetical protein